MLAGREAATLLGDRHPLVLILDQLDASRRRLALLASVHIAGLALWWGPSAPSFSSPAGCSSWSKSARTPAAS
jgi:hypothetical protein